MAVRAYKYGVRVYKEHEVPPEIGDQLVRRTRYWNALVELEQHYRASIDATVAPHLPDTQDEEALKAARKAALKLPTVKETLKAAQREMFAQVRTLRAASGLYWGTYLDVERSWQTARQRNPRDLRFHRSSPREGTLTVRMQPAVPVVDIWGRETGPLSIDGPPRTFATSARGRKRQSWMPFRFRVGGSRTDPVHLTGVVCLHRPLPEDALIREARLTVRPHNTHNRATYELVIIVELPDPALVEGGPVWGVDFGWRQVEGGLRVAVAVSDRGDVRQLAIPAKLLGLVDRAERLSAYIDRDRDTIRAALLAYFATVEQRPELTEEIATLARWRSPARYHRLWRLWPRHAGDDAIYGPLTAWHHRSLHLEQYRRGTIERYTRWRNDLYGQWAKALVAGAGAIRLEQTDWHRLAQADGQYAGRGRAVAAVGTVAERIAQTARREGVPLLKVAAKDTTLDCSWCGHHNDYDASKDIVVQ